MSQGWISSAPASRPSVGTGYAYSMSSMWTEATAGSPETTPRLAATARQPPQIRR